MFFALVGRRLGRLGERSLHVHGTVERRHVQLLAKIDSHYVASFAYLWFDQVEMQETAAILHQATPASLVCAAPHQHQQFNFQLLLISPVRCATRRPAAGYHGRGRPRHGHARWHSHRVGNVGTPAQYQPRANPFRHALPRGIGTGRAATLRSVLPNTPAREPPGACWQELNAWPSSPLLMGWRRFVLLWLSCRMGSCTLTISRLAERTSHTVSKWRRWPGFPPMW